MDAIALRDSPRARLEALPEQRRSQLLDPAEAEFAAHGFERASLNRILQAAGMSKGQAYYYVDDKADLHRAVIERALDRLIVKVGIRLEVPRDPEEFWAEVTQFFHRITEVFNQSPELAALARTLYEGPLRTLDDPARRVRSALEALIAVGRDIGAVRADVPPSLLCDVVFAAGSAIDRWFGDHWDELDADEALVLNDRAIGFIRAMCEPDCSHQPQGDQV